MQRYKDWSPTPGDIAGLRVRGEEDYSEWFVAPLILTRDSSVLEESNWKSANQMFEECKDSDDYASLSFGHWACGWFEIIVVKPDSEAQKIAEDICKRLEDYPVLDEDQFSEMEWDVHHDQILEACYDAINYAEMEEDVREHFDIASDDSYNLVLRSGFCPSELSSHLEWHYGDISPTNETIYDALLEIGGLEVDYV